MRKEVGSDVIVGNNFGNIGLITGGKYYSLRDDAHTKMVNCIKVTEYLAKDLVIITSSQDETVKFWDTSFNLLHEFSVRKIEPPKFIEMPPVKFFLFQPSLLSPFSRIRIYQFKVLMYMDVHRHTLPIMLLKTKTIQIIKKNL